MSKPKTSNRDYGYQPNMADSLYDMESKVTTEGMRMAGKVEKHSEFMEPNNQPYDDMEYEYPYPPDTMKPMSPVWPVSPGQNWPDAGGPEEVRVFKCVANCCCCDGDLVGPVDISCTYPIVQGPWVKNSDGTKCDTGRKDTGASSVKICMNPCGDGSCPPDVRCVIEAPAIKSGKTVKYPAERREVKVTMLEKCGRVGNPSCPPASDCCTGVSFSGSNQMNVGQSQSFAILNPVAGCSYEFRKISGGGSVSGNTYYAPATNPGCVNNAVVGLYDRASCKVCATLSISINTPGIAGTAYYSGVLAAGQCAGDGVCSSNASYIWDKAYTCDGVLVGAAPSTAVAGCPSCNQDAILGSCTPTGCCGGCGPLCASWLAANPCTPSPSMKDVRSAAMIAAGCCPVII